MRSNCRILRSSEQSLPVMVNARVECAAGVLRVVWVAEGGERAIGPEKYEFLGAWRALARRPHLRP